MSDKDYSSEEAVKLRDELLNVKWMERRLDEDMHHYYRRISTMSWWCNYLLGYITREMSSHSVDSVTPTSDAPLFTPPSADPGPSAVIEPTVPRVPSPRVGRELHFEDFSVEPTYVEQETLEDSSDDDFQMWVEDPPVPEIVVPSSDSEEEEDPEEDFEGHFEELPEAEAEDKEGLEDEDEEMDDSINDPDFEIDLYRERHDVNGNIMI